MQLDSHCLISARTRRQYLGISADDVAKRIGIKRTSYLRYERGERRVYFDHAIAIASLLDCKVDDLTRVPTPEEIRELYAEGQRRRIIPVDDAGVPLPAPVDATHDDAAELDNLINKTQSPGDHDIVVDTHAHAHTANTSTDLAAALAGWDDSE